MTKPPGSPWNLALIALLALSWASQPGCAPGGAEAAGGETAQGLVVQGGELFTPPEASDHDHPEGEDPHAWVRAGFHEFGRVPDRQVLTHTFELLNTDPDPVTIQSLDPSCGCTVPRVTVLDPATGERTRGSVGGDGPVAVAPPGATVEITVRVDTGAVRVKNIDKHISLRLSTDSPNRAFLLLECHLIVDLPFQATPSALDLGAVPMTRGGSAESIILAVGDTGTELRELRPPPPDVYAQLIPSPLEGGTPRWILQAVVDGPLDPGVFKRELVVDTVLPDGTAGPPFEIQLRGHVLEDVEVPQGRIILHGEPLTGEVDLRAVMPDETFTVAKTELAGEHHERLRVLAEPVEPDSEGRSERWKLRLEAEAGIEPGTFSGTLTVHVDGVRPLEKKIPYVGTVP